MGKLSLVKDIFSVRRLRLIRKINSLQMQLGKVRKELKECKEQSGDLFHKRVQQRRSIRKFSSKKIKWEVIYNILEAALSAPAAEDIKNYFFIVVQDKASRAEIARLSYHQQWIRDAPYIIVVCRDNERLHELYPHHGKTYAIQNTAAAIENLLLAAHFYNLGACWVSAVNHDGIKDHLDLPHHYHIDALVPIGTPLESPSKTPLALNQKLFFETYNTKKRE